MFISKAEKVGILSRIVQLEKQLTQLVIACNALQDAKTLAAYPGQLKPVKKKKSIKGWTPEARAIHGERMKLMWASRKAKKAQA